MTQQRGSTASLQITALDLHHLSAMEAIEKTSPLTHWTEGMLQDCLQGNYQCWGLMESKQLIGFGILQDDKIDVVLIHLCLDPSYRGQGVASYFLKALIQDAKDNGLEKLILEVAVDNFPARVLYERLGAKTVGLRPGYYQREKGRVDALIMEIALACSDKD